LPEFWALLAAARLVEPPMAAVKRRPIRILRKFPAALRPAPVAKGRTALAKVAARAVVAGAVAATVVDLAVPAAVARVVAALVEADLEVAAPAVAVDSAADAEEEVVVAHLADASRVQIRRRRAAFTLLELILALSLTVIVVLSITMAINVYWKQFNVRRTNVEEAQLARALLRHIADDLRSAMQYTPIDLSGLEAVAQNGAVGAAADALGVDLESGEGGDELGGDFPSGGSGQGSLDQELGGLAGGVSGGTSTQTSTGMSTVRLYGSPTELRMDISRLPRVDQYEVMLADYATGAVVIPSDIKTVTYFLRSEESAATADAPLGAATPIQSSLTGRGRGLMRREVDRATSAWAEEGMLAMTNTGIATDQARLLAEEVVGLSFQYFDGIQWLADWDSDQYGGLPVAVEILLTMSDADPDATDSPLEADVTSEGRIPTERTYRLVVRLPTTAFPVLDPLTGMPSLGPSADASTMEAMP
jgi:type II secretory pathway pseudopilin PulG